MDTLHCGYMFPFDIDFLWSTGNLLQLSGLKFETGATVGASDQWKRSQKLVVSMVKDQLKCDAPRLGIRSDVLDLPSTH